MMMEASFALLFMKVKIKAPNCVCEVNHNVYCSRGHTHACRLKMLAQKCIWLG